MTETPAKPSKDLLPRVAFFVACLFFAILYGFAAARYEWFPHAIVAPALDELDGSREDPMVTDHSVHPARHDFDGVRTYGDGPQADDAILLSSFWPDRDDALGLRLIDRQGEQLFHWDVNPVAIWPTSPHRDMVAGAFNRETNYIHGQHLFPNGDVMFNVEFLGLARLDARGNVRWRLDRRTHHSLTPDHEGNFWVCGMRWIETEAQRNGRFAGLQLPLVEDLAIKVSPDGEVLAEVSVLEAVYDSELRDLLWRVGKFRSSDVLHLNDVDPLPPALADQYPLFEAGDLMVSLRHIDCVFVFDPATLTIRWSAHEPFMNQHDPDYLGDGWISVFDNHNDGSLEGTWLGGSRIWKLRPHTGEVRQLYPVADGASSHERRFFTKMGGKTQQLDNGHWLISEAQFGRVFEIDADGRTVWEWGHQRRTGGTTVFEVLEGQSFAIPRDEIAKWKAR